MSPIDDRPAPWSRRHRAAILAAAVSLLSVTIAATTSSVLINRAQRETKRALDAQAKALAAQRLATEAKAAALAAETRAKEQMRVNFTEARETVEDLVTLIRDDRQFRETPALHPLREALLKRALAFSRDFVKHQ